MSQHPASPVAGCELCESMGGELLHQAGQFRVVLVDDEHYPGFCRVIWQDHIKEVTDLPELDRMLLMDVLWQVELVVREVMQPDKINLASFGNLVPHLHWHVVPQPIWGQAQRALQSQAQALKVRRKRLELLRGEIKRRLSTYP
jgi:diadenosine tetraphosphate (Ap4A) HIT family hydrolase